MIMLEKTVVSKDKIKIAFNHFVLQDRDTVIVLCHGFWMSKDAKPFLALSQDLFECYDVIAMDQRGHGHSGGRFSFTAYEHKDIKAIIDFAKKRYAHIYLIGFSLGAASSIIYAAQTKDIDGVIAVSAPMSFSEIENRFWKKEALGPAFKKIGTHLFKLRMGSIREAKINPKDVIYQISPIPLLIVSGSKDPIISHAHAETLYARAKEPKQICEIKNGLHAEDLYLFHRSEFLSTCMNWISGVT